MRRFPISFFASILVVLLSALVQTVVYYKRTHLRVPLTKCNAPTSSKNVHWHDSYSYEPICSGSEVTQPFVVDCRQRSIALLESALEKSEVWIKDGFFSYPKQVFERFYLYESLDLIELAVYAGATTSWLRFFTFPVGASAVYVLSRSSLECPIGVESNDKRRRTDLNQLYSSSPSLLVISIDSVSRAHAARRLPLTLEYLHELRTTKTKNAYEFTRYNVVGAGTGPNLCALFSGRDLHVPTYYWHQLNILIPYTQPGPFLWTSIKEEHKRRSNVTYRTAYGSDACYQNEQHYMGVSDWGRPQEALGWLPWPIGAFFTNFDERLPTSSSRLDTLLSSQLFCAAVWRHGYDESSRGCDCIGSSPSHSYLLNDAFHFMQSAVAESLPFFVTLHMYAAHDQGENALGLAALDSELVAFIQRTRLLEPQAMIVVTSDHGLNYGKYYDETNEGFAESLNPWLWILLPTDAVHQKHLYSNQNALITPFDVHATLLDYMKIQRESQHVASRSLFRNTLASNRTCTDAGVPSPLMCLSDVLDRKVCWKNGRDCDLKS